ncbi:RNA polymerase sigma-70 factor [Pedobacter petrophilus]|uniref:RNA polymerase sigma-70 factor n=1 Tax=Pedobacter petrophilus TaxID=1908241 RepID=A0A7K0G469_9SPHI|nr:RNA polymerase sigma-70 factor [Pedobacter petrophilus]MRX78230.1 RNA polymerase sigma-70 factor [Pedobacter petrophilus]
MQKELANEKLILANIATGDQQAFGILFNFYRNKVYGYALAILQEETAAEEIVQDVFIKLWVKRQSLPIIENFGGFLRTIARNETLNALKKVALEQKKHQIANQNTTDIDSGTENEIQFRETKKLLETAIEKLPPQQKLIYNLCHIEGLKQKDVAQKLNISPLTVKTHLRDAIKSIKNFLIIHDEIKVVPLLLFFIK